MGAPSLFQPTLFPRKGGPDPWKVRMRIARTRSERWRENSAAPWARQTSPRCTGNNSIHYSRPAYGPNPHSGWHRLVIVVLRGAERLQNVELRYAVDLGDALAEVRRQSFLGLEPDCAHSEISVVGGTTPQIYPY